MISSLVCNEIPSLPAIAATDASFCPAITAPVGIRTLAKPWNIACLVPRLASGLYESLSVLYLSYTSAPIYKRAGAHSARPSLGATSLIAAPISFV